MYPSVHSITIYKSLDREEVEMSTGLLEVGLRVLLGADHKKFFWTFWSGGSGPPSAYPDNEGVTEN